ncbi:MAG: hypothetical protein JW809_13055 [Pirellulales bacterium]|nr:hypothetical protein [Pirellulales bacterium]
MHRALPRQLNVEWLPGLWRLTMVAACTLILCACRAPRTADLDRSAPPALPREAWAGMAAQPQNPGAGLVGFAPEGMHVAEPAPGAPAGPWAPPGIRRPWPEDEYLADGGDRGLAVTVAPDWTVRGLDAEDTIAHFDTLDGQTVVTPSNPVHLYAPRFGAVRKVTSVVQNERATGPGDVRQPTGLVRYDDVQEVAHGTQNIQPGQHLAAQPPVIYQGKLGDGALSTALGPRSFQDAFMAFESCDAIRFGHVNQKETARLAEGIAAAIVWTDNQAVQVILDHQSAAAEVGVQNAHTVFGVEEAPAHPRLRIIKVASTQLAKPGEPVDFTLRFDNVGNQLIGNVTIVDNLATRLEYVPESAQCNLPATFSTQPNDAGSTVLRWEITDPLPVNQGGIIRFRCRVR